MTTFNEMAKKQIELTEDEKLEWLILENQDEILTLTSVYNHHLTYTSERFMVSFLEVYRARYEQKYTLLELWENADRITFKLEIVEGAVISQIFTSINDLQ